MADGCINVFAWASNVSVPSVTLVPGEACDGVVREKGLTRASSVCSGDARIFFGPGFVLGGNICLDKYSIIVANLMVGVAGVMGWYECDFLIELC